MKNFKLLSLLLVGLLSLGIGLAYAVEDDATNDTQTSTVTLTIDETVQLGISNASFSESLNRDGNSETSFDAGYYTFSNQAVLNVDGNKKWRLQASIGSWTLPISYPAGGNKNTVDSTSDIALYVTGGAHITGFNGTTTTNAPNTSNTVNGNLLSSTAQTVANADVGVSNDQYTCTYTVFLDWTKDIPGTYAVTTTYTLVTEAAAS